MIVRRTYDFNVPRDTLITGLVEEYIKDPTVMINSPDVTGCEVKSRKDNGNTVNIVVQYSAYSQIPKFLQRILEPKMLTWLSYGLWDRTKLVYSFKVETFYFTKQVSCQGVQTYHENGENASQQKTEMKLKVNIPVFGPYAEKEVARAFVKNLDEGYLLAKTIVENGITADEARLRL